MRIAALSPRFLKMISFSDAHQTVASYTYTREDGLSLKRPPSMHRTVENVWPRKGGKHLCLWLYQRIEPKPVKRMLLLPYTKTGSAIKAQRPEITSHGNCLEALMRPVSSSLLDILQVRS